MSVQIVLLMLLSLVLSSYFAATLGVAGLAKIEHQQAFAQALRQQKIVPKWSASTISYTFPWVEIILAVALALRVAPIFTASLTTILTILFFGIHITLYNSTNASDCGCFSATSEKVDLSNVITSGLFMCLAIVFLGTTMRFPPIPVTWRIAPAVVFIGGGSWLIWRIMLRHRIAARAPMGPPQARPAPAHMKTLEIGEPVPSFALPDLSGNTLDFDSFRGQRVVMLFWNPRCGFCARMLDALKRWESDTDGPPGACRLLVVSQGLIADNTDNSLQSPVVLDNDSVIKRKFGATGTPMAIAVDATGLIASELVVGSQAVFELLTADESAPTPVYA